MKRSVDTLFKCVCLAGTAAGLVLAVALVAELAVASADVWRAEGLRFVFSSVWDPGSGAYGAAGALVGTLATTGRFSGFAGSAAPRREVS